MGEIIAIVGDGNFNRQAASQDSGAGFVFGGAANAPTGLANGEVSGPLTSIQEAEALGITKAYDDAEFVLMWHHLNRHFKRSPKAETWIVIAPQSTTIADMADNANAYLSELILQSEGKAKTIGIVMNPASGYTPAVTSGIDDDAEAAIAKAQETIDAHAANFRRVIVVLEARSLSGTAAAMTDFRENEASGVVLAAIADPAIQAKGGVFTNYADVGTVVGIISSSKVSENGGWTQKFNLQDKANGFFTTGVGLSDGSPAKNREAEWKVLTDKGLTIGRTYAQQQGVYLNDSPTCQLLTSDFAYWTEVRVMNKAILRVYDALFPKINSPIKVDAETGQLDLEVVKSFEAIGQGQLDLMEQDEEISGGESFIDPSQDVTTSGKIVNNIRIVSIATGRTIEVQIGFTKQLS